jgi:hypothetical protein
MGQSMMVDTIIPPAQLKPNMDIFAAGYAVFFYFFKNYSSMLKIGLFDFFRCSLIELFTEGYSSN